VADPAGKQIPLLSPVNILIAIGALVILAGVFILFGNQIFSPGDLSGVSAFGNAVSPYGNHADFESQCALCHQPFRSSQAGLCTQCHQDVGAQMADHTGVHGAIQNPVECRACHPDHRGRNFEMVQYARQYFDHAKTQFPLDERHAGVSCQQCHTKAFTALSPECGTCHTEPAVHAGLFPKDCANCHQGTTFTEASWQGKPFDHEKTGFSLKAHQKGLNGKPIACQSCHEALVGTTTGFACQECHTAQNSEFMTAHVQSFGTTCTECHDGVDRMQAFDHNSVFPLTGKHAELVCANCHTGQVFQDSQTVCATCHQEPEIHAGSMGLRCQMCHTPGETWTPARLQSHDFPLDHGGGSDTTCTTCHVDAYTQYTCYSCHDHEQAALQESHLKDGITADQFTNCMTCHIDGKVKAQP